MFSRLSRSRNLFFILAIDSFLLVAAYYMANYLRFDGEISFYMHLGILLNLAWMLPVKIAALFMFDLYKGMWRYTSIYDMISLIKACVVSSGTIALIILTTTRFDGFSRGVLGIDCVLMLVLLAIFRVAIRIRYSHISGLNGFKFFNHKNKPIKRLLLVGAGDGGEMLLKVIGDSRRLAYDIVGFVDDDSTKLKQTIRGVPVLGLTTDIEKITKMYQVDEVIIAIPSATAKTMRRIIDLCKSSEISFKTLPSLEQLVDGRVAVSDVREVRYEDLLGRDPVCLENDIICEYLTGKRVLVTGGAGSIGSELCRQIAQYHPERLIIIERNESGLYELELDLLADNPGLKTAAVLGAIQNKERMGNLFSTYQPQVVFHAAAYKHVPMMEQHPWEAVFNNIVGSQTLMELCLKHHVERCVIVSTDKAVRPTNVMGATKRVIEMLAQSYVSLNRVRYIAVRFGNVLGSAGSVLPLFEKQVTAGGPVTVTHPDVTRYFMTIPEASSLIMQAGSMGRGGEIFILKMGTPIRISDMARDLITLSGYTPNEDIEIKYTGLRPGEKLFEELITRDEGVKQTGHEDIMVLHANSVEPLDVMNRHIDELVRLAAVEDTDGIKWKLKEIVPEYCPDLQLLSTTQKFAESETADEGGDTPEQPYNEPFPQHAWELQKAV